MDSASQDNKPKTRNMLGKIGILLILLIGRSCHIAHKGLPNPSRAQVSGQRIQMCFSQQAIEYLGHLISSQGLATKPTKLKTLLNWPVPKTVNELSGYGSHWIL